jgi:asparagine synthase (glutamine-hydrolysing)
MCGFAGCIDTLKRGRIEPSVLAAMTNTLTHRGPDSSGFFVRDNVGLGFRRLKIIDPETGEQPLFGEDESNVLVCNGEIYNYLALRDRLAEKGHRFTTRCDVEVLVHLYEDRGPDLLNLINGQFAFAIYDSRRERLLLARDHFGINPLFYTCVDGLFVFASEIKAILAHPQVSRQVDLTGLDQVLSFPGLISPVTMFKGIHSLKSGCYLTVEGGEITTIEYWDLNYPRIEDARYPLSESEYIERLSGLLAQSVKYRLQSDVPVGFYLSGGLDSSLIGALIHRMAPAVRRSSFSITFPEKEMAESPYQEMLSSAVGSIHHSVEIDWREIVTRMERMILHCECPVKETYNTCSMALSEAAKRAGITVILTGEGADELFAGYVGYRFDRDRDRSRHQAADLEAALEAELREELWGDSSLFYEKDYYAHRDTKSAIYSDALNESLDDFECVRRPLVNKQRIQGRHFIHQRSYLDFKLRLSDHLISDHGDRMAMASSVEARYPFLDIDLVEFATQIPPDLKLRGYTEKYILKRAAEGLIPRQIIQREKFGFHAPGSPYLLANHRDWINDLLSFERIKRQGYFNPAAVQSLMAKYSRDGFRLNLPFQDDLLLIVLTFGIFLDLFKMPSLN